jgi:hypothetical protein
MTPAAPQTAVLHAIRRPDIGASRAVSIAKNYYEKLMITAMFTLHPVCGDADVACTDECKDVARNARRVCL